MLIVRKGKKSDIKACTKIAKTPELAFMNKASEKEGSKYLSEYITKGIFFVAEEKENIVGYIAGEYMLGNFVWVDVLVVKSDCRGKGIGKKLFTAFKKYIKEKGYDHLYLVAPKFNTNTVAFYEKLGLEKGLEYYEFSMKF